MTYVSYDDYGEEKLRREQEAAYEAGVLGEKTPHNLTSGKERHTTNATELRGTLRQFTAEDFKKRLHGTIAKRLEQELKWLKHYECCLAEHKKGLVVDKLKKDMVELRKNYMKKEQGIRTQVEQRIDEARKERYKDLEARVRRKWDVKWKRKGFFGRLGYILGGGTKLNKKKNKDGQRPKFYQFETT